MSVLTGSIQIAYKTAAQWTSGNLVLLAGQEGHESDTGKRKIGDGSTAWNSLGYLFTATGTVTGSGTANKLSKWTSSSAIGNSIVTEDTAGVGGLYLPDGAYISGSSVPGGLMSFNHATVGGQGVLISADQYTLAKGAIAVSGTYTGFLWNGAGGGTAAIVDATGLRIYGGTLSPGSGKIWTSDATGYGSWTTYTGSSSVTTLGTIASGTWNASAINLTYGGTNASLTASNGGIVYSTSSAMAILAGTSTAGQILRSGSSAAPSWSTATYPATTTANRLLYSSATNTISDNSLLTFDGTTFTANGVTANASGIGIGVASTSTNIINGTSSSNAAVQYSLQNTSTSTAGQAVFNLSNSTNSAGFKILSTGFTTNGALIPDGCLFFHGGAGQLSISAYNASGLIGFYTAGFATGNLRWQIANAGHLTASEGINIITGTTTGSKIGTATSQKIGFWNATPIVQPTTAVAAATFVANTSLIANDTATFDGYTIGQVVKALRNAGILA